MLDSKLTFLPPFPFVQDIRAIATFLASSLDDFVEDFCKLFLIFSTVALVTRLMARRCGMIIAVGVAVFLIVEFDKWLQHRIARQ